MATRVLHVLDSAVLTRRGLLVLELDAPSPIAGVAVGMEVDLAFRGGARERVRVTALGFASSTPDHAHLVVTLPGRDVAAIESLQIVVPSVPPGSGGR